MIGLALVDERLDTFGRESGVLLGRGRFFARSRFMSGAMPKRREAEADSEGGGLVGGWVSCTG